MPSRDRWIFRDHVMFLVLNIIACTVAFNDRIRFEMVLIKTLFQLILIRAPSSNVDWNCLDIKHNVFVADASFVWGEIDSRWGSAGHRLLAQPRFSCVIVISFFNRSTSVLDWLGSALAMADLHVSGVSRSVCLPGDYHCGMLRNYN